MSDAAKWFRQAERELAAARNALASGDWFAAAFWAQQAAEKALKAVLLSGGVFARGHDLVELGRLAAQELGVDVGEVMDDLRELTVHYTISRCPNAANAVPYELYDGDKAGDLVRRTTRVLEWARRSLR